MQSETIRDHYQLALTLDDEPNQTEPNRLYDRAVRWEPQALHEVAEIMYGAVGAALRDRAGHLIAPAEVLLLALAAPVAHLLILCPPECRQDLDDQIDYIMGRVDEFVSAATHH